MESVQRMESGKEMRRLVDDTVTLGAPSSAKSAPQWVLVASELKTLEPLRLYRAGLLDNPVYCITTDMTNIPFVHAPPLVSRAMPAATRTRRRMAPVGPSRLPRCWPFASASAAGDAGSSAAAGFGVLPV
jgi:hypothetical protein